MLRLYNAMLSPLRLATAVRHWLEPRGDRRGEWLERRAVRPPVVRPGGVWLHGASVGEARVAGALAAGLRARRRQMPICVSAVTPNGRRQIDGIREADAAFYVPLDFRGLPGRVLDAVRPKVLILIETELWPNLVHEAGDRGVAIVILNARLSPERLRRYAFLRGLYRPLLDRLSAVGAQSDDDARRFVALGAHPERVRVTGNVKYDLPTPAADPDALRSRFGIGRDRPVVVAGSTGPGEERLVLEAFLAARRAHRSLFLVLAPRHPERAPEVFREALSRQVSLHRLSDGNDAAAGLADGLLVDGVGELARLYGVAWIAFVGGSLVPVGGHNVLEPAAAGVPVLFGPHTGHVKEPAEALERAGGALRVVGPDDLGRAWIELIGDSERRTTMARRAAGVVRSNRGALDRSVSLVVPFLDAVPGGSAIERKA